MQFNAKLFISTFVLIFLAELGDKTQLAAMAKSIEGRTTVFLAASSALICSTLIAVLCGDLLTRVIPERVFQVAAAVLFILFGAAMLYRAVFAPAAAAVEAVPAGRFARFVVQTAVAFEEVAAQDYERLAESQQDPALRRLLLALAAEERAHAERLKNFEWVHAEEGIEPFEKTGADLPTRDELHHDVADDRTGPVLEHAIEHELATAGFYETLARTAKWPSLKASLQALAQEELRHAEMLRSLG